MENDLIDWRIDVLCPECGVLHTITVGYTHYDNIYHRKCSYGRTVKVRTHADVGLIAESSIVAENEEAHNVRSGNFHERGSGENKGLFI